MPSQLLSVRRPRAGALPFVAGSSDAGASALLPGRYLAAGPNFFRGFGPQLRVNRGVAQSSGPLPAVDSQDRELIRLYRDSIRPLYRYVSRRVGGDRGLAED